MGMVQAGADRVNWVNVALMVGACAASLLAPLPVFLFAYAVLGPGHYLTEISWLHDRQYFAPRPLLRRGWLVIVTAAMVALAFGYISNDLLGRPVGPQFEMAMVCLAFAGAAIAIFVEHPFNAAALIGIAAVPVAMSVRSPLFALAAYLLVTMVHVLLFTGCFMLHGALKARRPSGFVAVSVFLACVVVTAGVPGAGFAPVGDALIRYAPFEQLNRVLLGLLGEGDSPLYSGVGIRVMQLIAFAYTYHYLNWFSKTSVIRWHEIPRKRGLAIVALWVGAVALYSVHYAAGFAVLYVLSILHVLLEFPLDHRVMADLIGLGRSPVGRRAAAG